MRTGEWVAKKRTLTCEEWHLSGSPLSALPFAPWTVCQVCQASPGTVANWRGIAQAVGLFVAI